MTISTNPNVHFLNAVDVFWCGWSSKPVCKEMTSEPVEAITPLDTANFQLQNIIFHINTDNCYTFSLAMNKVQNTVQVREWNAFYLNTLSQANSQLCFNLVTDSTGAAVGQNVVWDVSRNMSLNSSIFFFRQRCYNHCRFLQMHCQC